MKYILTEEKKEIRVRGSQTIVLYRIRAIKDFTTFALVRKVKYTPEKRTIVYQIEPKLIKAGQPGGFVQSEINLSHSGTCWIDGDAVAFGKSLVSDDAYLGGQAGIGDFVVICDDSKVTDKAQLGGKLILCGRSKVIGNGSYQADGVYSNLFLGKEVKKKSSAPKTPKAQKNQKG